MKQNSCEHFDVLKQTQIKVTRKLECLRCADKILTWVQIVTSQACGILSSYNSFQVKHASAHEAFIDYPEIVFIEKRASRMRRNEGNRQQKRILR